MNCDDVRMLLEGGLPAARALPEARHHLDTCADCRGYASRLQTEDALLAGVLRASTVDEQRFARVKAGVRRKLNQRARKRVATPARHPSGGRIWWLAAAGLLLAATTCFIIARTRPHPDAGRLAQEHLTQPPPDAKTPPQQPPPETEKSVPNTTPTAPATWALPKDLAELQSRLRTLHLLDDLNQVQVVMRSFKDTEGLGVAEDAELYLERIYALRPEDTTLCREVLSGIREADMATRLSKLKERWRTPETERVARTLEAGEWALGPALQPTLAALAPSAANAATFAEAERVFRKRDYNRALNLYRSFAEHQPKDQRVLLAEHTTAFILQKKLKEPAEARETYQRMAKNHAKEQIGQTAYFHLAETLEDDGRVDNALEQYGNFLDLAPKHPRANEANRRSEALRRKQKGEPTDPTWSQVLLQKKKKTKEEREQERSLSPSMPR